MWGFAVSQDVQDHEFKGTVKCFIIEYFIVYYWRMKKMIVCEQWYDNFLINEEKVVIDDHKTAQQILFNIHKWIEFMKVHGEKYNISEFYHEYFDELKEYNEKLKEMNDRLSKVLAIDNFIGYLEIKYEGIDFHKALMNSNTMNDFRVHLAQISFSIANEEVSIVL